MHILYFSQKQMPREIESRLVIIVCAGYIFWQLFLRLFYRRCVQIVYTVHSMMYIVQCTLYTQINN